MTNLTRLAALAFLLFIVWVIYMANAGHNSVFFDFVAAIPYGDKLGHVGLFGTLTFLTVLASQFAGWTLNNTRLYFAAIAVTLFVIGEEISQAFIPSRTFDVADLSADAVGILLAILVLRKLEKTAGMQTYLQR
ncbi:VanZ family protein [Alteromonas oceani]|jgi:VanZ family protein|uniref:VanZ family protein n=1 Tax=Alteromonas oceani TaxID=2071609 RepID=A0ABV7K0Z7_9ALTE|nr:VanZ family protein [Alteromonas oceani]HAU93221.1 trypsin [Alteromonas sp.]HCA76589.1 trypsin [Alteromonas sp.]HCB08153.1 trypsin [Alteromonas sp.]HCL12006.1 trypsin [Alteromonas sp.]HCV17395.1 trypsin [Alteromonas sp.]|tara:strand:- start:24 stop:425 length:402 start_codon:yes stop_codon:yes gene_type:complete